VCLGTTAQDVLGCLVIAWFDLYTVDSGDEMMMAQLLQYGADAATDEEEKFMTISCLLRLKLLIVLLDVEIPVLGRPRTRTNMGWPVHASK
jgi:hypothetical protein